MPIFKERISVRLDFSLREKLASVELMKPGLKISRIIRQALRKWCEEQLQARLEPSDKSVRSNKKVRQSRGNGKPRR